MSELAWSVALNKCSKANGNILRTLGVSLNCGGECRKRSAPLVSKLR